MGTFIFLIFSFYLLSRILGFAFVSKVKKEAEKAGWTHEKELELERLKAEHDYSNRIGERERQIEDWISDAQLDDPNYYRNQSKFGHTDNSDDGYYE